MFDVAEYRNGKAHENDIDEDGIYIVVNSKFVSTDGEVKKYSNKQNEPLLKNEIAFVLSDVPNGRAIAKTFLVEKSNKYTLNQRIAGITPHSDINPKFLSVTMNRNKYFLQFDDGVKQTNLSLDDMKKFEEFYPRKMEQDKIGEIFSNIDNLITLHHRKYSKKLQTWEQRKLNTFVEFYSGLTYSPKDIIGSDGTLVLRSSNVKKDEIVKDDNVFVKDSVVNSQNVKKGDIIVVVRNGSRSLIGKHAQIKEKMPKTVIGAFMTGIRSSEPNFVNSLLNTSAFNDEIEKNMGATINQITGGTFNSMEFKIPKRNTEQEKIGQYFKELDNLITLHQHQ